MTAEIGILNRSAVALAADSAVTIGTNRAPKIFNSVNKLFTLSKYHPVGVMIYGSAQLLNAPWETIIKVYRKKLGRRKFRHLEEYSADFFRFLEGRPDFFAAIDQEEYFGKLVGAFYTHINEKIQEAVKKHLEQSARITKAETQKIVTEKIDWEYDRLRRCKRLRGFAERFGAVLCRKHAVLLRKIQKAVFQKLPLSSRDKKRVLLMAGLLFVRDDFGFKNRSGLVIAGFGDRDNYPRLQEFMVEGVIEGKVRYRLQTFVRIGVDTSASINAFAQSEVVQGFIDGVDPAMERVLRKYLDKLLADYPSVILSNVPNLTAKEKARVSRNTKHASEEILKDFLGGLEKFRRDNLVDPIVSTVAVLPKNELAAMAETLVSLTSFKRRFSFDSETVGGPIDVAVLSKGDGFVWIKRKHYFEPTLNPNFLTRYFDES